MQEQIRQDTGEFKVVEKRGKTIYYRRIEQPSKKDTMICGERPIAYSTKGDYLWFSEAYNNCDSWEELRMVLEFSHSKELLSVVDAYVKCGAEYNEVIFETEPRSEKEWWALYKEEMREHYDCVKAGRVSRYI